MRGKREQRTDFKMTSENKFVWKFKARNATPKVDEP